MRLPGIHSVNKRARLGPLADNEGMRPGPFVSQSRRAAMTVLCEIAMFAALLLLPPTVRANDGIYTFGRGAHTSCGQFIAAMLAHKVMQQANDGVPRVSERALIMEYVDGLLTGVNLTRDHAHQMTADNAAVELWLRNWCVQHPDNNLLDAVSAFSAATPGGRSN